MEAIWLSITPSGSLLTLPGSKKPALLTKISGVQKDKHQLPNAIASSFLLRSEGFALIVIAGNFVINSSTVLYKATSPREHK